MSSEIGKVDDARPGLVAPQTLIVEVGGGCVQLSIYERRLVLKGEIFLNQESTFELLGILEAAYREAW